MVANQVQKKSKTPNVWDKEIKRRMIITILFLHLLNLNDTSQRVNNNNVFIPGKLRRVLI